MKKMLILFLIASTFTKQIFAVELEFLKEAIINGNEEQAKQILKEFRQILLTDKSAPTALHLAAQEGNLKISKKIIKSLKGLPAHEASSYLSIASNDESRFTAYQFANNKAEEIKKIKEQINFFDKELKNLQQQKQNLLSIIENISQEEILLKQSSNQRVFFSKQEEKSLQENKVIELMLKIAACEEEKSKNLPVLREKLTSFKAKAINYTLIANSIRNAESEFECNKYR